MSSIYHVNAVLYDMKSKLYSCWSVLTSTFILSYRRITVLYNFISANIDAINISTDSVWTDKTNFITSIVFESKYWIPLFGKNCNTNTLVENNSAWASSYASHHNEFLLRRLSNNACLKDVWTWFLLSCACHAFTDFNILHLQQWSNTCTRAQYDVGQLGTTSCSEPSI